MSLDLDISDSDGDDGGYSSMEDSSSFPPGNDTLDQIWDIYDPAHNHTMEDTASMVLGGNINDIPPMDLATAIQEECNRVFNCFRTFRTENDCTPEDDHKMRVVCSRVAALKTYALSISGWETSSSIQSSASGDTIGLWRFMPIDDKIEPSSFQIVLMYLLDMGQKHGYHRYRENLMQPIRTEEGYMTGAWKVVKSIEEFVGEITRDKHLIPSIWAHMTKSGGYGRSHVDYLLHSQDVEIPWLHTDRHLFSFQNGLYLCKTNTFIPYETLATTWTYSHAPVSAKYFNSPLDETSCIRDPMDIPTPAFDKILRDQDLPPDVTRWVFILIGRCLYDIGELDDWQIYLFLKGMAGTGKSKILEAIANIYEAHDVGYISNRIEVQFGLAAIAGKYVAIADDVRKNFQMDQSDFQNAASGNAISVAQKYKEPKQIEHWTTPIVWSGNELPDFHDNAGSYGRRMAVVGMKNIIQHADPTLGRKLRDEAPTFIVKCNRMYLEALRQFGASGIWEILPQAFKEEREDLTATSNVLVDFLQSGKLEFGPDHFVPISTFRERFYDHVRETNAAKPHWTKQYYTGPFTQYGLSTSSTRRAYDTSTICHRVHVMGCDLVDNIECRRKRTREEMEASSSVN